MGDSLSAGYGISQSEAWVALLQQKLDQLDYDYRVVNASITGDTTRGGLSRLPSAIEQAHPDIIIIELGGNDGLRGLNIKTTTANLDQMITIALNSGAKVLLLGIQLPHNYGQEYRQKFHRIYLDIAQKRDIALVPFFLEGVAETRAMMQPDGIHPAAEGQPIILANIWPKLVPLLQ